MQRESTGVLWHKRVKFTKIVYFCFVDHSVLIQADIIIIIIIKIHCFSNNLIHIYVLCMYR